MYEMLNSMMEVNSLLFQRSKNTFSYQALDQNTHDIKGNTYSCDFSIPIIQPAMNYIGATRQVKTAQKDGEIRYDDYDMEIKIYKEKSKIKQDSINSVIKKMNMIIIYSTEHHGYNMPSRMLRNYKAEFYNYYY